MSTTEEYGGGVLAAIWRFITFKWLRRALSINRAADQVFTGSVTGIADAFDLQQNKMVKQFNELRDAIAQVEEVIENKRQRLETLNNEEADLIPKREGAVAAADKAKVDNDQPGYERHAAAFTRFQTRIDEIEGLQSRLQTEIGETEKTMRRYMMQLTKMQSEIQNMPEQKAGAIADFVSAKKIIELNDRLMGLESSFDRGPISAVLAENRKLTSKARITEKLAGADVALQDQEYEVQGRQSTAQDKLDQMLAARKAEREARTGQKPEMVMEERPKI